MNGWALANKNVGLESESASSVIRPGEVFNQAVVLISVNTFARDRRREREREDFPGTET